MNNLFTASLTGTPPAGSRKYIWKFKGCGTLGNPCPDAESVEWTFSTPAENNLVRLEIQITRTNGNVSTRNLRQNVPVTGNEFTVNILPTAGCTVMAGDGGVDAAEPNGIICSGGMAADDALCTEQFDNNAIASLKVVPDAGYTFTNWEMNGGIIMNAKAEPLFLSTMPLLASIVVVPSTNTATMKAHCLSLSLESVTFEGMPAAIVQDNGTPYPTPHWQTPVDPDTYRPSPVVFTSGSAMTAKATFNVQPADFSGKITIMGSGTGPGAASETILFPPTEANVNGDKASVTISSTTTFPDNTIDIFDPMSIVWSYKTASGCFQEIGTSTNQVYVTRGEPLTSPLYHTLVDIGCYNAKGEATEAGTVAAIWEEFTDQTVLTVEPKKLLRFWHEGQAEDLEHTADLLREANGQCGAWAEFFIDLLKVQHISASLVYVVVKSLPEGDGFLVKNWDFVGSGSSPGTTPYIYIVDTDAIDEADGLIGQGNHHDPPSSFYNHYVVTYDHRVYDPSFGTEPFNNQDDWENASLAGFFTKISGKDELYAKPNDPDTRETIFIEIQ